MNATTTDRWVTPSELLRMKGRGVFEAARGRLVEKHPTYEENWTVVRVGSEICGLRHSGPPRGDALMRQSFQCFDDPTTVRRPDVSFLAINRLPYPSPPGHVEIRPDLAVEVCSALDDPKELELRLADYRSAAIPLVWVVMPTVRRVRVLPLNGTNLELTAGDKLTGGDVLPGFSVPVSELFRPAAPRG